MAITGQHGMFLAKRGKGELKIGISEQMFVSEMRRRSTNIGGYKAMRTGGGKTYWSEVLRLLGADGAGGIVCRSTFL